MTGSQRSPIAGLTVDGARARRAADALTKEGSRLAAALRRAVPFLSRRGVRVSLASSRSTTLAEVVNGLARPFHLTPLSLSGGEAPGALIFDAAAASLLLDGVLGGTGEMLPELNGNGLSGPQEALLAGLARNVVRAFSAALQGSLGVTIDVRGHTTAEAHSDAPPVACVLQLQEGDRLAEVILLVPRDPLLAHLSLEDDREPGKEDPRIASLLGDVELLVVVELGRVSMRVGDLATLKVGDTLRLDVPVSGLVSVRSDGRELMRGRPTTSGGRIAVKIATPETAQG
jgi:flagellar motor switch protein FliM